ncbi:GNAT family N-acetyltransferase [Oerskovia jenensis]|uniref:Ribosomal protein S18 acetylase RimI-like enzyme n=1 Tax=Oerskovia jenensis TaxID=162169 RepID=A0ABS2LAQ7_9CELL|nr:GNAT family N-acetyltransferase [Oerskovia jenensis]MBM7477470.1 ribosomal protein S18 acetylase RimI-like enzyme [Oerskovia jenensis]
MDDVTISRGFTEDERGRVASLYWEAFGRKLRPGFVDEQTGVAVVRAALRRDQMLVARQGDDVIGVCGFYDAGAGAADLRWSRLRQALSVPAALRASLVLSLLSRSPHPGSFVLDGICVDRAARGLGVGTALLGAASEGARRDGARTVRLSVIDGNPRARALYERQGFVPVDRGTLGLLSPVYGFDGYTTMERTVDQ